MNLITRKSVAPALFPTTAAEVERCLKHRREFRTSDGCPECLREHLATREHCWRTTAYALVEEKP